MKNVQVRTRGEGMSKIGDFTAYVLYGCPLTIIYHMKRNVNSNYSLMRF